MPTTPTTGSEPLPDVRHLACIGLMGAGKTTVGRMVADRLGWGFVDVDDIIEARTGCTVGQLWETGGEEAYRPLEFEVVAEAVRSPERTVLATPGGIVLDRDATQTIAMGDVVAVYLRALPETLASRIAADDQSRPLLDDHPGQALKSMFVARDHCYEDLADHVIQVDDLSPEQVVAAVLEVITGTVLRPEQTT